MCLGCGFTAVGVNPQGEPQKLHNTAIQGDNTGRQLESVSHGLASRLITSHYNYNYNITFVQRWRLPATAAMKITREEAYQTLEIEVGAERLSCCL